VEQAQVEPSTQTGGPGGLRFGAPGLLAIAAALLLTVVLVTVIALSNPPGRAGDQERTGAEVTPGTTAPGARTSGAATATTAAPAPRQWTLDPAVLDFGSRAVGSTSGVRTVFVRNRSTRTGKVTGIQVEGDHRHYRVETRCAGIALQAGFHCRISVTFAPTAVGEHHARIRATFDDPPSRAVTDLIGTGTP
jgi:hypothetical protein